MKRHLTVALFALFSFACASADQGVCKVTVTRATDGRDARGSWTFIDADNASVKTALAGRISASTGSAVFMAKQPSGNGRVDGPILVHSEGGDIMTHEKAGRDFGIGAGLCLGGCLFVIIAGKDLDPSNPPSGFYAYVGKRYVDGGMGCVVGALWIAGLVFVGKAIIELFLPHSRTDDSGAVKSTEQIIAAARMNVIDKEVLSIPLENPELAYQQVLRRIESR